MTVRQHASGSTESARRQRAHVRVVEPQRRSSGSSKRPAARTSARTPSSGRHPQRGSRPATRRPAPQRSASRRGTSGRRRSPGFRFVRSILVRPTKTRQATPPIKRRLRWAVGVLVVLLLTLVVKVGYLQTVSGTSTARRVSMRACARRLFAPSAVHSSTATVERSRCRCRR